jgi:hypothetical protein
MTMSDRDLSFKLILAPCPQMFSNELVPSRPLGMCLSISAMDEYNSYLDSLAGRQHLPLGAHYSVTAQVSIERLSGD